jgi:hypothetical protein
MRFFSFTSILLLILLSRLTKGISIWESPITNVPKDCTWPLTKHNASCTTSALRVALPLTCISVETIFCLISNIMVMVLCITFNILI